MSARTIYLVFGSPTTPDKQEEVSRWYEPHLIEMCTSMGRAVARRLGLRVTGLVGVLIKARERGLLTDADAVVNDLHQRAGFWLSNELRQLVVGK